MYTPKPDLRICADLGELSRAAADLFAERVQAALADSGRFTVALAGGSTPRPIYEQLATPAYQDAISWHDVHVFWGDERCVPPDHPDSNYRMAREALLDRVAIPSENVHRMKGEETPETAAAGYAETVRDVFGLTAGEWPRFDLILLGMGNDGHTASLFPHTPALRENKRLVVSHYVDKLDAQRLTLTFPVINKASCVAFLVAGQRKAHTLHRVLEGPHEPTELPSQLIQPADGDLIWLVDEAAASQLPIE